MTPFRHVMLFGPRRQTTIYNHIDIYPAPRRQFSPGCIFGMEYPMMGMNFLNGMNIFQMMFGGFPMFNRTNMYAPTMDSSSNMYSNNISEYLLSLVRTDKNNTNTQTDSLDNEGDTVNEEEAVGGGEEGNESLETEDKTSLSTEVDDFNNNNQYKDYGISLKVQNEKVIVVDKDGKKVLDNDFSSVADAKAAIDSEIKNGTIKKHIYDVEQDKTYVVQKWDTWYGIAVAKYDIPQGLSKLDVAYALAAANSGESDPVKALQLAKRGLYFAAGDNIKLPNELNVNGKTVRLLEEKSQGEIVRQEYSMTKKMNGQRIQQAGGRWYVTVDGVRQSKGYATEAEARANIPKDEK